MRFRKDDAVFVETIEGKIDLVQVDRVHIDRSPDEIVQVDLFRWSALSNFQTSISGGV